MRHEQMRSLHAPLFSVPHCSHHLLYDERGVVHRLTDLSLPDVNCYRPDDGPQGPVELQGQRISLFSTKIQLRPASRVCSSIGLRMLEPLARGVRYG
jgi:hypothetical protein